MYLKHSWSFLRTKLHQVYKTNTAFSLGEILEYLIGMEATSWKSWKSWKISWGSPTLYFISNITIGSYDSKSKINSIS